MLVLSQCVAIGSFPYLMHFTINYFILIERKMTLADGSSLGIAPFVIKFGGFTIGNSRRIIS